MVMKHASSVPSLLVALEKNYFHALSLGRLTPPFEGSLRLLASVTCPQTPPTKLRRLRSTNLLSLKFSLKMDTLFL